jgi:hypothetical protein
LPCCRPADRPVWRTAAGARSYSTMHVPPASDVRDWSRRNARRAPLRGNESCSWPPTWRGRDRTWRVVAGPRAWPRRCAGRLDARRAAAPAPDMRLASSASRTRRWCRSPGCARQAPNRCRRPSAVIDPRVATSAASARYGMAVTPPICARAADPCRQRSRWPASLARTRGRLVLDGSNLDVEIDAVVLDCSLPPRQGPKGQAPSTLISMRGVIGGFDPRRSRSRHPSSPDRRARRRAARSRPRPSPSPRRARSAR